MEQKNLQQIDFINDDQLEPYFTRDELLIMLYVINDYTGKYFLDELDDDCIHSFDIMNLSNASNKLLLILRGDKL